MKKIFVTDGRRNDDYSHELMAAYQKMNSSAGAAEMVSPDELTEVMLSDRMIDVVISNGLDKVQHNMLKQKQVVSIVFDRMDVYGQLADIVIDNKANDPTANYGTSIFSLIKNPEFDFSSVADLVRKLSWDTEFWGYGIGSIKSKVLNERIYQKCEKEALSKDVKMLEYLCSCDDRESMRAAENLGFHLSDIRITFEVKAKKVIIDPLPDGLTYGIAGPRHIPELIRISKNLYRESRYYFDGNFNPARVSDFYNAWVEKAVLGTFDHICYCIFNGDKPVGFATFRQTAAHVGYIGLAGFAEENKGQGLGKKIFSHLINESADKGITQMATITQGRNYSAQRLFQSIGFKTSLAELWYHKWIA